MITRLAGLETYPQDYGGRYVAAVGKPRYLGALRYEVLIRILDRNTGKEYTRKSEYRDFYDPKNPFWSRLRFRWEGRTIRLEDLLSIEARSRRVL